MGTTVIAFGGNALSPEEATGTYEEQRANATAMTAVAARLAARGHRLVLTHGNGPQAGHLALQQDSASSVVAPQPLFSVVAMTQGSIGSLLTASLHGQLAASLHGQLTEAAPVVALVTHVVVDVDDPAFDHPTKPIGPWYDVARARRLADERGWAVAPVDGGRYRRVVPSPAPREIVELPAIRSLVAAGAIVVAAGGGGIPVTRGPDGSLRGVDAVIDKDLAAERLASALAAETLVMLTAVPEVALDYGTPQQRGITEMTVEVAASHLADGQFPAGSMGPKVTAAVDFVKNGGRMAVITSVDHAEAAVDGRHGTRIVSHATHATHPGADAAGAR